MRYNVPKGCATLLSPRGPSLALRAIHLVLRLRVDETICVAARYPALRICGYMARKARPCGRKNSLPFSFSERSPLSDFRQIRNKGNGIHKGGNLGVHPCAHRRGYGEPPSQVLALIPAPQDTAVKTCRKNWLSTLSTGLSTGYLGITLCIKWITFCIHPRRPPYISVFRLRIVISAVEKPPLHNPPHLVENL